MKKRYLFFLIIIISFISSFLLINYFNKSKVPILGYHSVTIENESNNEMVLPIKQFEEEINYLKKHNYKTLTLDEFYE